MSDGARRVQIAICGPGEASEDELRIAEAVGHELARLGAVVVCGGLGGAMEAACRGAKGAGGTTVGIVPGYDARSANAHVDVVIASGLGQARNAVVVGSASAVIAVGGGAGTLSEVALAVRLGRSAVLIGWREEMARELEATGAGLVQVAGSVEEAARIAMDATR